MAVDASTRRGNQLFIGTIEGATVALLRGSGEVLTSAGSFPAGAFDDTISREAIVMYRVQMVRVLMLQMSSRKIAIQVCPHSR